MLRPGLRERKRQQTHDAITAAALHIFQIRGYDAATLDEIADAASVGRRTLQRYFPTKSHLVLHSAYRALEDFRAAVTDRGPRPVLDVWEEYVRSGTRRRLANSRNSDATMLAEREPSIIAEQLKINREYHEIIAGALKTELATRYDIEVVCHVLAAGLVSGQSALYSALMHEGRYQAEVDKIYQVIQLTRHIIDRLSRIDDA